MGSLRGVTRVTLREDLTSFPREIFDLSESLEILDLSDNQLSTLPEDFGNLSQLKILFLSNNNFTEVPKVLASCPKLEMIAFKSNRISHFPENALPLGTKWLMLTNNQIGSLPESFGQLTRLRKLALAGNELTKLPDSIKHCQSLELVRFSANRLSEIPTHLLELPNLSWLGFSGNAIFNRSQAKQSGSNPTHFESSEFVLKEKIGQGASGDIFLAEWASDARNSKDYPAQIAVKLFKDQLTSDGYAVDEMDCAITAGSHPNLIKILGHISEENLHGLVMELIPSEYTSLGQPPDFSTCTRDTFPDYPPIDFEHILSVSRQVASVLGQIHQNEVSHGDIYAHNILVDSSFSPMFGDFGAATHLVGLSPNQRKTIEKIEVRAFGCLIDDLLGLLKKPPNSLSAINQMQRLSAECMDVKHSNRPDFEQLIVRLNSI